MRKILNTILLACLAITAFVSCSKEDVKYYDAIPSQSKALVRVAPEAKDRGVAALELFMGDGVIADESGVDFSVPVYLFAAPDGSLGVCAKVEDDAKVDDMLEAMAKSGKASQPKEIKECKYAVVNKNFLVAYNENALVAVGPVLAAEESKVAKRLMRYLELNADRGVSSADIFKDVEADNSPISLIASVSVMPKKLVVPFLIGAPTGTSTDDVVLKAEVNVADSLLTLKGRTTSSNLLVSQGIDNAMKMLASGKSEEIIRVMEANKDLQSMLNKGGFREKLQKVQGRMLITQSGNDADVETLLGADDNTFMKVVLNLKSLDKEVLNIFEPFLGGVSRIEYEVR